MATRRDYSILLYLCITFVGTWAFWIPAIFVKNILLLYIGGVFPSLTGALLASFGRDRINRRNYWNRVFNFKLIKFKMYIVIFLIFPVVTIVTFFILRLLNAKIASLDNTFAIMSNPLQLCTILFGVLIGGPLPEELGWRGFLLDCFQKRMNALKASILLGLIHAFWHIPLFFIEGTLNAIVGLISPYFALFILQVVLDSIIFTWIYNNNNRSIMSAILLHYMINLTAGIITQFSQIIIPIYVGALKLLLLFILVLLMSKFYDNRTFLKKI